MIKHMAAAAALVIFLAPAANANPLAAANSASGAVAVAGGGGGGSGGSSTGSVNNKTQNKTFAAAVGFPASANPADCTLYRGFLFNALQYTTDSPRCTENDSFDAYTFALINIGDKTGAELTQIDKALLWRVAGSGVKNCRAITGATDWAQATGITSVYCDNLE